MSSTQFNAGQSRGGTQAKTEQFVDSAKSTADSAVHKAENAAGNAQQSAQQRREEQGGAAGFLQQTGEQVINAAQGAIDGVKNTLGMGDQKK
ncbi:unnamed protein product [Cuscuta campestris]|uniref:Uncharacterized protein n=2 Tax=Cuscuta sect. Cleistogrammica TaxID=1824901 RepID=A0A484NMM3_9ASTE|nr:hypothetical protein DM860_001633 [Cuscuta australis]VFR01579.1 unnamed protein product [Cuscuta campestris]